MDTQDFNQGAKLPRYSYTPSPVQERAFLILRRENIEQEPVPVGDYMVLDTQEDLSLSEKKVMNLVSSLNGKETLVPLGEGTSSRTLFHLVTDRDEEDKAKIIFYQLEEEGVSKENALFRIENDDTIWN